MTPQRKKALLIAGAIGLAIIGYLFLRSKSAAAAPTVNPGGGSGSPLPSTDSSGSSDPTQANSADLLAALAGENQQLIKSFLDSEQGLISLVGSSLGATTQNQQAGEPTLAGSGFSTTTPASGGFAPLSQGDSTPVSRPIASTSSSVSGGFSSPAAEQAATRSAAQVGASYDFPSSGQISPGPAPGSSSGPTDFGTEFEQVSQPLQSNAPVQTVDATDAGILAFISSGGGAPQSSAPANSSGSSGAGGVKAGQTKTNYQAKARAY